MLFMAVADWVLVAQGMTGLLQSGLQIAQMVELWKLMNKMTNGAWLLEQARKFGFEIDKIIVSFSEKIYSYFQKILGGTLLTPSIVNEMMSRVYIVVGIFIFFKLAMVAIKYMMNPESFLDDKVGAQTLVKRVIIGSVLIIMIPTIFKLGTGLQSAIIEDRVIEKIILPKDVYLELTKTNTPGRDLTMTVFKGFFNWNEAILESDDPKTAKAYKKVETYNNLNSFPETYINNQVGDIYVISYVPIISTLAIGYLMFMLLKYAMEVLFRSIKLVFLQLLSPFVIVNYMLDPEKEDMMKKWTNATISTYLMIFLRVITLWFSTLVCYYLNHGIPLAEGETSLLNTSDGLLKALIIIALFAFLKDLPKFVSDIFGYNLQENETIDGVLNQGVGVLKGFAMAKIGKGFAKRQLGYNMASSTVGGFGNALGAMGKAQANGAGIAGAIGAGVSTAGQTYTTMTGALGGTVSGLLHSTPLSSVSAGISSAGHNVVAESERFGVNYGTRNGENNNTNKDNNNSNGDSNNNDVTIANNTKNMSNSEFISNLKNDPTIQNYISGGQFNLSSSIIDNSSSNPVVDRLSERVFNKLPSESNITLDSIKTSMNNYIYSEDSPITNPVYCSESELEAAVNYVERKFDVPQTTIDTSNNSGSHKSSVTIIQDAKKQASADLLNKEEKR